MKQILFLILSAFLLTSCGSGSSKQEETVNPAAGRVTDHSADQTVTPTDPSVVYVYYFHGSQRCKTCVAVEKAARESVATLYGEQEQVRFVEVPTDEAANKGLVEQYGVTWNALIVAKGDDHVDITQKAFANPEGVSGMLQEEVERRLS